MIQEYSLGREFTHKGQRLKVVASGALGCTDCAVENECSRGANMPSFENHFKYCFAKYREDNISIKFVKVQTK